MVGKLVPDTFIESQILAYLWINKKKSRNSLPASFSEWFLKKNIFHVILH